MTAQTLNFTEAVAAGVASEGVTHAFGLMGAGTIRLTHHLTTDHDLTYHAARHEAGAVGAADGYARITRTPGVAMITWGPALTNTITALVAALRGGSPVVLIAGDSSGVMPDRNLFAAGTQRIDQQALLEVIGVPVVRAHPRSVVGDVARAFASARARSAPTALLLPMEYETSPCWPAAPVTAADVASALPAVDEEAVGAASTALAESERPIIIAGRGAVLSGAREALIELADRSGALLATTLKGKDLFVGHPFNLGIAGGYSGALAARLFGEADAVLAFGASLNAFTTKRRRLFPSATLVQCDVEPEAMIRNGRPGIALQGDARTVAELLVAGVEASPARSAFRDAAANAGLGPDTWRSEFVDTSSEGALDPRAVCARLDALLPLERTIVADAGAIGEYPPALMRVPEPDALLWLAGDFGAVGTGLSPAIGAAVGRPDRLTTLVVGDGGFFMSLQELDLAVRDRIPMLVVCLNDRAYGSEYHHMHDDGLPDVVGARFETPDLAALARAMGCEGERIDSLDQLDAIPARLQGLNRPLVLDCQLTQELVPSQLRPTLVA